VNRGRPRRPLDTSPSYLPAYLPFSPPSLPTDLSTYLPPYRPTYPPVSTFLPIGEPISLPTSLPPCLPSSTPSHRSYLPTCHRPSLIITCLPTCRHIYLPSSRPPPFLVLFPVSSRRGTCAAAIRTCPPGGNVRGDMNGYHYPHTDTSPRPAAAPHGPKEFFESTRVSQL
jgi:hypothetical protein